jgi:biotin carboxylase
MTHAVEIPQVVARVAKALGLPGIAPEVADTATNKLQRLTCFRDHGVPCARFASAGTLEEAFAGAEKIGFPCVFKPIDRSGARGVILVNGRDGVEAAFRHSLSHTKTQVVLIEEYLTGRELSTESIICGRIFTVAFADRNYDKKRFLPFFIEDGGEMPTSLPKAQLDRVMETVNAAIKALGITWGVAKGDVLVEADGTVKIIEMAVRTSGGRFCSQKVPMSTGINLLRPLILMAVGLDPDLDDLRPKFSRGVAERFIFPRPGVIVSIMGVESARNLEGVCAVHLNSDVMIGNHIDQVADHTMRKGYVVATGDTREQAVRLAERAAEMIKIVTR